MVYTPSPSLTLLWLCPRCLTSWSGSTQSSLRSRHIRRRSKMCSLVLPEGCCAMTDVPDAPGNKAKRDEANAIGEIDEGARKSDADARGHGRGSEPVRKRTLHPLFELTLTRVREFVREPEVIFWVFIFPVLLACALGLAFRNTAPEKIRIAVEGDAQNAEMAQTLAALEKSADVMPVVLGHEEAAQALRTGNVALVVRVAGSQISDPGSQTTQNAFPQLIYRYDPTRPE